MAFRLEDLDPKTRKAVLAAAGGVKPAGKRPRMLVPAGGDKGPGWASWTIPVAVESEANIGGTLRAAMARKAAVKRAVCRAIAPYWIDHGPLGDEVRRGRPLHVILTRIGGRTLDRGNLPRALKPVEDAVATILGLSDGDPLWRAAWRQEPGPLWGVRVELRADDADAFEDRE